MKVYQRVVVLTGAGISKESGISTFRDADGLWAKYDVEEVATPEAFARNPALVHEFYNMRRREVQKVKPNPAHDALVRLEREYSGRVTVVTQNVDPLHGQAGSRRLVHMHGELLKAWCRSCNSRMPWTHDIETTTVCPKCRAAGAMRPDIVWFGEMPYHMEEIYAALQKCDLFISIGTSGNVYPAAGFVAAARSTGAHTVELNLEPSEGVSLFAEAIHGPATAVVPAFIDRLLAAGGRKA
jgi:NAD-dependent deacetylase